MSSRLMRNSFIYLLIIVALIAIAAIGVVTLFGDNLRKIFGGSSDALSGKTDTTVDSMETDKNLLESKTLMDFNTKNNPGK